MTSSIATTATSVGGCALALLEQAVERRVLDRVERPGERPGAGDRRREHARRSAASAAAARPGAISSPCQVGAARADEHGASRAAVLDRDRAFVHARDGAVAAVARDPKPSRARSRRCCCRGCGSARRGRAPTGCAPRGGWSCSREGWRSRQGRALRRGQRVKSPPRRASVVMPFAGGALADLEARAPRCGRSGTGPSSASAVVSRMRPRRGVDDRAAGQHGGAVELRNRLAPGRREQDAAVRGGDHDGLAQHRRLDAADGCDRPVRRRDRRRGAESGSRSRPWTRWPSGGRRRPRRRLRRCRHRRRRRRHPSRRRRRRSGRRPRSRGPRADPDVGWVRGGRPGRGRFEVHVSAAPASIVGEGWRVRPTVGSGRSSDQLDLDVVAGRERDRVLLAAGSSGRRCSRGAVRGVDVRGRTPRAMTLTSVAVWPAPASQRTAEAARGEDGRVAHGERGAAAGALAQRDQGDAVAGARWITTLSRRTVVAGGGLGLGGVAVGGDDREVLGQAPG